MPNRSKTAQQSAEKVRSIYGIGEWYGKSFVRLTPEERRELARAALSKKTPNIVCPFKPTTEKNVLCSKKGGVCTIRLYQQDKNTGVVSTVPGPEGQLVTLCPHRLKDANKIFRWVGEKLLGDPNPLVVSEVGFLEKEGSPASDKGKGGRRDVGRIDKVLVHSSREPMHWCTLEMQAVYFSGRKMREEFRMIQKTQTPGLPFPLLRRRPDYRSSGPKRLMPQLQIKVSRLSRWGKKMAVVLDRSFASAMGVTSDVADVSNCEVAWFIVRYVEQDHSVSLELDSVLLTTLQSAVEALTGGRPLRQEEFEAKIREKLAKIRRKS
ncbi:MAG TPA: NotI family restriction endonuclease [Candidatus Xenobia bacterium]|nr:NotI family restriction endonuclease [Candidatus Xenobia bacterium]